MKLSSFIVIVALCVVAYAAAAFVYSPIWNIPANSIGLPSIAPPPFILGLDLQGGVHLVYRADLSEVPANERGDSMQGVRDVIERRVNLFGVGEPIVQLNTVGEEYRLIVDLPGIDDVDGAIKSIGETPHLEFRKEIYDESGEFEAFEEAVFYEPTGLTGRHLKHAQLEFDSFTNEPTVSMALTEEGAELFAVVTEENLGRVIAIFLDGEAISTPIVQSVITNGQAQITGRFTIEEARELVQRLNAGALPVPIELIQQDRVGPSLGALSLTNSLNAALWGLLALALFIIGWYRGRGVVAVIALVMFAVFVLALFKLIPVTVTLAGIAGFLLSTGMAVDANVLIFERMKEEKKRGREPRGVIEEGFSRAWPSIRDGSFSTILTAVILYAFGTSVVKGFALTLFIGVFVSLFTAVVVTRTFLRARFR